MTALVAAGALANLVLALVLLRDPARAADLQIVYDWCSRWLRLGEDLYATLSSSTDYPPNAIATLSPLSLIPQSLLVPVWASITLALTFVFAFLVVRVTDPRATRDTAALPVLLFLCWGGVRMLLQFTRLTITLAYAAIRSADTAPVASGILLGLALAKPQIAGPIALWMLVTKRWRPLAVASVVVVLCAAVYMICAGASPAAVATGYLNILRDLYADPTALVGRTSIRRWAYVFAGDSVTADLMWAVAAAILLAIPCRAAIAQTRVGDQRAAAAVPALFCLWSLLVWFHLGNNFVLMFPAFAFLLLVDDPETRGERMFVAAAMQLPLMLDVPVHLLGYVPRLGPFGFLVVDADRFVAIGAFFYLANLAARLNTRGLDVNATQVVHSGDSGNNGGYHTNPLPLEGPPNEISW